jgi:hypothetical protein
MIETIVPPTTPLIMPAISGAPCNNEIPKQSGIATKKTTRPALRSAPICLNIII